MSVPSYIALIVPVVFVVVGILFFGWFKIVKETNALLREQNNELKIANKELLDKHAENVAKLGSLQGQIDVLKSIPLVNIDTTLKEISKFNQSLAESNQKILTSLEHSASILAENTAKAADKVEHVKTDLESDDNTKTRLVKSGDGR